MSAAMYVKVTELERRLGQHETRLEEAEKMLRTFPERPSKAIVEARAFLRQILTPDARRASEVLRLAHERAIAERTLRRAKAVVGVVSFRVSQGPGRGPVSWWRLPGPPLAGSASTPT